MAATQSSAYSITGDGAMLYTTAGEPHGLATQLSAAEGSGNGMLQDYCEGAGRVDMVASMDVVTLAKP